MSEHRIYYDEMESPIGSLLVAATDTGVCNIEFGTWDEAGGRLQAWARRWVGDCKLVRDADRLGRAAHELREYFDGRLRRFTVPVELHGTPFQKQVWEQLALIEYGTTCSYKQVAEAAGKPRAVRAVGGANNRNPVPIMIPCHRVIGSSGDLVGYGGGLSIKIYLLQLEGCR